MIKINKPKFWDKQIGFLSILFFPLSLVFLFLIFLKKKIIKEKKFKFPIICIGNIYTGGTGKTPASVFLAKELSRMGKKPVIVRKYYKHHNDEYHLIKNHFKNLIVTKNRLIGLKEVEDSDFDIAILDDGLQDYNIKKNQKIVCFNSNQLDGNGLVLPAGPLRETLYTLKNVDIVLINGDKVQDFENKILNINKKIEIFYSSYKPTNLEEFKNKKLLAIAGIGNPENFFQTIKKNNLDISKKIIFPDHYEFSRNEIQNIVDEAKSNNYQIIMTEKDYFKVNKYKLETVNYLKVTLEINEKEKFLSKVKSSYA